MNEKILTIIVPAKNEEQEVANTLMGITDLAKIKNLDVEIIAINDGSRDKTLEILKKMQEKIDNLIIVNHIESLGVGASFLEAVKIANGKYVFMVPGDNENDPSLIFEKISEIKDEDLLVSYVINKEKRSFFRRLISSFYTFLVNKSFGMNLKYFNGTSLYRTDMIKKLDIKSTGFFFTAEILIKSLSNPINYKEVGILLNEVEQLKSNALTWNSLKVICHDYFQTFHWFYFSKKRVCR